jgi:hypothetical protein
MVLFIVSSCAAMQAKPAALRESDLKKFITVREAEAILGEPYYSSVQLDNMGKLNIRYYLSTETRHSYEIAYWKGKVYRISSKDVSGDIEKAKKLLDGRLEYGLGEHKVEELLGPPRAKRGEGFSRYSVYGAGVGKAVLLLYVDGALKAISVIEDRLVMEYLYKF